MKLIDAIVANAPELTALRRDLHAYPELAYQEFRTASIVAAKLQQWGFAVETGIGGTGVVGTLCRGQSSATLALRADMDALPMDEENHFAHSSRNPGCMHACGHDGHVAMLLGAAQCLAQEGGFDGSVRVIFQPAEEQGAGASAMIRDGLFERFPAQAVFGLHNMPGIAAGHFAASPGAVLASNSDFRIVIHGRGGHAAMPQQSIDPIVLVTQIIQSFQTIISRDKPPLEAAVISVTTVHAGSALNVIPDCCELGGTVRAYSAETLDLIERRMGELAEQICAMHAAQCTFEFQRLYPATINHPAETAFARSVLEDMLGEESVLVQSPLMAAEDFSFMLEAVPGCYCFIGNGDGRHRLKGHGAGQCLVHNSSYDFNDEILTIGASFFVHLVRRWLSSSL